MNPDTLRQLAANCRCTNLRSVGFPHEWRPTCVRQPETDGLYFTNAGAWEFIADQLDAKHPYEEVRLDRPPGAMAIVMKIQLALNNQRLYVKIQIGAGNKVIGRSFHYSDH